MNPSVIVIMIGKVDTSTTHYELRTTKKEVFLQMTQIMSLSCAKDSKTVTIFSSCQEQNEAPHPPMRSGVEVICVVSDEVERA